VITTLVQTRYQKETTPTRAVVIFSIEPVFATILASIFLQEHIGTLGIVGGGLIIVGVLVSELSDMVPFIGKKAGNRRGTNPGSF
jgi:drug/metabolite transporter (DMT)-like permease